MALAEDDASSRPPGATGAPLAETGTPPEEEKEEGGPPGAEEAGGGPPKAKRVVPGVLYLPSLPPGFGPRHARALLGPHGDLGRVFLQPLGGRVRKRRGRPLPPGGSFAEGWVEFRDKRAAKRAAALLHGTPMAPRPRSPFRHHLWNLKYLPGLRWPQLSERLAAERRERGQRLRAEVAQAKREGGFYARNFLRDPQNPPRDPQNPPLEPQNPPLEPKNPPQDPKNPPRDPKNPPRDPRAAPPPTWAFTQRATEEEIWGRKARPPPAAPPRRLLEKVWGGGA